MLFNWVGAELQRKGGTGYNSKLANFQIQQNLAKGAYTGEVFDMKQQEEQTKLQHAIDGLNKPQLKRHSWLEVQMKNEKGYGVGINFGLNRNSIYNQSSMVNQLLGEPLRDLELERITGQADFNRQFGDLMKSINENQYNQIN